MGLRPVNSFKHVLDANGTTVAGVTSVVPILTEAVDRDSAVPASVPLGAKVFSIFFIIFVLGSAGGVSGLADWLFWKNPRQQVISANRPTPGNVGTSVVRNMVIHEEKGIVPTSDGTPMVFKGVLKIPKHMQRIADNDNFEIRILSPTTLQFCVKAIYKDYQ